MQVSLIPLSSQTHCADWNPDTGATSHMTPHRHWFHTYTPMCVPIRLADNTIIYSAGVGATRFEPVLDGKKGRVIEFSRCLHVPKLRNNLLSVLHLTRQKGWIVKIQSNRMFFLRDGKTWFSATVDDHNQGRLDGQVLPVSDYALSSATVPLDLSLWHRRFGHIHVDALRKMQSKDMVTGLDIQSAAVPDPICEPCIAGKQRRSNVPKTASRYTTALHRVFMDVHGPMPVQTPEGYRYWTVFVDDATRFWCIALLRNKSDAFLQFKAFKAMMENQTGKRIKIVHFDKGGVYQHCVPNIPAAAWYCEGIHSDW